MFDIAWGADPRPLGGAQPLFTELRLILVFALVRFWAIARTCRRMGMTSLAVGALLTFLLGAAASVIKSGAYPSPIGYWEQICGNCLLFVLILATIDSVRQFQFMAKGLVFAGGIVSLVALYPVAGLGTPASVYFTMVNRLTFGTLNPNEYAYRLLVLVVLSAYLLVSSGKFTRPVYVALTGLFLFSIVLTYSRGAMLGAGTALSLAALLFVRGKRGFLSVALLLFVAALAAPYAAMRTRLLTLEHLAADDSALYRANANALAWETIRSHPLLGVGGNEVNTGLLPGLGVHNGYLLLLCDGGLLEFLPLGLLLAMALYHLWRRPRAPAEKGYALLCGAMAILLTVWALILNATVVTYPFWISLGLAWAVIVMARQPAAREGMAAGAFERA
ncbi:MAG TPA: O-antigen ligase family protein [Candidatus Acidoferrales bacterium]|nr:O-antigen ligase family protein [Candidatus Acidoferrales bacterium]